MISNKYIVSILFVVCIVLIIMNAGINGYEEPLDVMEIQKYENEINRIEELYASMEQTGASNNIQEMENLLQKINTIQTEIDLFLDRLKNDLETLLGIEKKVKYGIQYLTYRINILN